MGYLLKKKKTACWGQLLLAWENLGKSKPWGKRVQLYEKAIGNSLDESTSWVVKASETITRLGQIMWTSLIETQIRCLPIDS